MHLRQPHRHHERARSSAPSSGRDAWPVEHVWRAVRPAADPVPEVDEQECGFSADRRTGPAGWRIVIEAMNDRCGPGGSSSVRDTAAPSPSARSPARRAASMRLAHRPRRSTGRRPRLRERLGARLLARRARRRRGSGPWRNAIFSTQRQPRCALTRSTMIAQMLRLDGEGAVDPQHQRRRRARRVGSLLRRAAAS